jgi:hypothetical protein
MQFPRGTHQRSYTMVTKRLSVSNECQACSPILKTAAAIAIAGMTALALGSTVARATVVYQDNFSGSSSNSLVGLSPTTDTGSATWATTLDVGATDTFQADGSVTSITTNYGDYLPFTPENGNIYTLSATLDPASTGWVGMSFGAYIPADHSGVGPSIIAHYEGKTATITDFSIGNTSTPFNGTGNVPLDETASIVLNTMSTQWTATYYYNSNDLGSVTYAAGSNPTGINGVAIAAVGSTAAPFSGSVANFELQAVPEPATLGLFALGGMGLLMAGRKMKRGA